MRGKPHASRQRSGRRVCAELGMRRVDWIRIVCDGGGCTCQMYGIGHRLPVVKSVPLATALNLAAEGVPVLIRERSATSALTRAAG